VKPIAGLVAAFLCAWYLCPIPPRHPFTSPALIAAAVWYTGLIAIAALLPQVARVPFPALTRSLTAAICFAPLIILAIEGSPLAAIPLIALVVIATPLFGVQRRPPPPARDAKLLRQFPSSILAAIVIQFAAVEALLHHGLVAGLLLSAGGAILAWRASAIDPPARLRGTRIALTLAVAFALVYIGMLPFLARLPASGSEVAGRGNSDAADRSGDGVTVADSYRGIILLPEHQPHVTLVPPLPALARNPFRENTKRLQIPFFGVYWFFRSPDLRPPKDAVEMRGTPSQLTFRSHDRRPLRMEAHQSLGTSFKVSCCASVQVSITNRNREPASVAIELILVDTFNPAKPFQSLGVLPVQSVFREEDQGPGVAEVLDFPFPQASAIAQFDEFTIRFSRPYIASHESANVAIDGFKLIPR
jgi:hypothetical protein